MGIEEIQGFSVPVSAEKAIKSLLALSDCFSYHSCPRASDYTQVIHIAQ
jgi:hypothetical protein